MNYDRELIARMLESGGGTYTQAAIDEQIAALREADNATEARTVCREQQPAGDGVERALDAFDDACLNAEGRKVLWTGFTRDDRLKVMRAAITAAGRGGEVCVPPAAEEIKRDPLVSGIARAGDWAIQRSWGSTRIVNEQFARGWNQCREAMLAAAPQQPSGSE